MNILKTVFEIVAKCLLLLLILLLFERCMPKKSKGDIVGAWYHRSDSSYLELIIWPNQIHSKSGKAGNSLWVSNWIFYYSHQDLLESALENCQLVNDSLLLFNSGQSNAFSAILTNDQIHVTIDSFTFYLSRVSEDQSISELSKVDTLSWKNVYFNNYLQGFYLRRDVSKNNGTFQ